MPRGRGAQGLATALAASVLFASLVVGQTTPAAAGAARPHQAAPPAPAPGAPPADRLRLVDAPDGDPVLDDVAVVSTAATRSADDDFAAAGRVEALRAIDWQQAERRHLDLLQLSFGAVDRVGQAEGTVAAARGALQAEELVLAARRGVERRRRAALAVQQDELRRLVAAVVASNSVGQYDFLGDHGDYSAGERRAVVRERGLFEQTARVEAKRRPWARARTRRRAQDREVALARRALRRASADLTAARADRDHVIERLRAAEAVSAEAQRKLTAAHDATADVRVDRRRARLLAPVEGLDLPLVALHAYWMASAGAPCLVPWWLVAGVGRVESRHGTAQRSTLDADGNTTVHIRGIPLDGRPGTFAIPDTDGGRLDGDTAWDRAVGPMQFLPGTWGRWATDDNLDTVADPHNLYDAAGAAAAYLCYRHGDLTDEPAMRSALFSYNRSVPYGTDVLGHGKGYRDALDLPDLAPRPDPAAAGVTPGA